MCIPRETIPSHAREFGIRRDWRTIRAVLARRHAITFRSRRLAEGRVDARQLVVYAVLRDRAGRLLSYRRGQYSSAPALIRGARCLGFGGHVLLEDADNLFGLEDAGIMRAAYREIAEELGGTVARNLSVVGAICDESSPEAIRHLGIVVEGRLPDDFAESRSSRERAVNDLRFLSPEEAWRRFHEFEFWSQLVLRERFPEGRVRLATVLRPRHPPGGGDVVVVTGEIATGKSTFSKLLSEDAGFRVVSTRDCVANVMGIADFGSGDRSEFQRKAAALIAADGGQRKAAALIAADGGVERLVDEIEAAVRRLPGRAVVDGVRHKHTLAALRRRLQNVVIMFIDCARDDAFRYFRMATGRHASVAEFRRARAHRVEQEVVALRHEADAYIFNGGQPEAMLDVCRGWWGV